VRQSFHVALSRLEDVLRDNLMPFLIVQAVHKFDCPFTGPSSGGDIAGRLGMSEQMADEVNRAAGY